MTDNGQLDFLDILGVLSFVIAVINLDENLSQSDKQELLEEFNDKASLLLTEIHNHLKEQDVKLSSIEQLLKEIKNDAK
jgi:hypothetical protein